MLSGIEKSGEEPRFPQASLPEFTPLHLQSPSSPSSRRPQVREYSGLESLSALNLPNFQPACSPHPRFQKARQHSTLEVLAPYTPLHRQSAYWSPSTSPPIKQHSRLLSIPAEIRLIIYEHVFASETVPFRSLDLRAYGPYQRATAGSKARFLLTCRQIAMEATPALYAHHIFHFSHAYHMFRFPQAPQIQQPFSKYSPRRSPLFSIFGGWRMANLSHVSVSYFLDNETADRLNVFDTAFPGFKDDPEVLDSVTTEMVRFFRSSCPRMRSLTLEMATGSSPRLLQGYCTADMELPKTTTTTARFGSVLDYKVLQELKEMSCLEGGSLERLRLVAVTEQRPEGKTMQIVGAGSKRWHAIKYRHAHPQPMWVFAVEKNFKKEWCERNSKQM